MLTQGGRVAQRESAALTLQRSLVRNQPCPPLFILSGRSSVGRASASQAEGRGFEPRRPLQLCRRSSMVEQLNRNQQVVGSSPIAGSR